jgi:two-component system sensor histidine kinase MtrB
MVAFGLLGLVVATVVVGVCIAVTRGSLVGGRERSAERQAFLNARAVRGALVETPADRSEALDAAQTSRDGAALLELGAEWYSTSVSAGPDLLPPELLDARDGGAAARQRVQVEDDVMIAVAVPIAEVDATYVELVPLGDVEQALGTVTVALLVTIAATALVATGAGWFVSGRVLRPVGRMAVAANQIREGSLDQRLAHDGDADLEPLVVSFNLMVDGLEERIEREARFASDVTHELRSPLATMSASLSVARRRADDPMVDEALEVLEAEVRRFTQLIDELLEIGRAEAGVAELAIQQVEPRAFVRAVVESSRHDVDIEVGTGAGEAVLLDKRRMAQALTNLLDNADNHGGGATRVVLDGDASSMTVAIDDAGPGVPEHERHHVFGRFARGRRTDAPGTGLGLALVREHVRLHGGDVSITTSPDGGARFAITIPREQAT